MADTAEIGVFGGSGFYSLLDDVREVKVDTPYGAAVGFGLPRRGRPGGGSRSCRATAGATRSRRTGSTTGPTSGRCARSGVKAVISPCAAGSLQLAVKPGDFVVCDQFVDRTHGRIDTFYDGPIVTHLSSAEIYDPVLRRLAIETIRDHGIEVHERGTVVVIEGPRFSTKSESKWFSDAGWEVINMTQYPEAWLCRELGMAVVNISLITDYDAGVHEGTEAVDAMSVLEVFQQNAARIQAVVLDLIGRFPADLDALGARAALGADPRRRPRDGATRTSACSRPGSDGRRRPGRAADRGLPPDDPRRARLVARERPAPRRGRLRRPVGLGPLHGQGRPDRAGRRELDDPVDGRRGHQRGSPSGRSCSTS